MPICSRLRTLNAIAVAFATLGLGALAQAATFNVTQIGDSGAGSLRQAIVDANANPGADTIQFTFAIGSPPAYVNLLTPLPAITGDVTIIGQGQTRVIVEIDPITNPAPFPLLRITGTPTVEVRGLSFTRGGGASGGAILAAGGTLTVRECTLYENSVTDTGGGLAVIGSSGVTLNLIDSSVLSNTADLLGGGVAVALTGGTANITISGTTIGRNSNHDLGAGHLGGGLYIAGGTGPHTVNITTSTIADNSITFDGSGGGAYVDAKGGTLSLLNSTISGNNAGMGSALAFANATVSVRSCTITANNSMVGGTVGCVRDINNVGMTVKNTIISGNISGGALRDLDPGQPATGNNNLIGLGGPFTDGVNGNIVGVTDPRLFPMNINGGLTLTFALMPDSPALDRGSNADAPPADQRGQMRPSDGDNDGMAIADIGAFETQRYLVTNTNNSGLGSLRMAILDNNTAGGGYVKFAIPAIGQQKVIFPKSPLPMISRTIYIDAWSQGGQSYQGPPLVEINGEQVPNTIGLDIQWSDCIVRGVAVTNFLGPTADGIGIKISTRYGLRNWVYGCYVGVALDGVTSRGNGQIGVWIGPTANTNTIGTNGDGLRDMMERNVISGTTASGLRTGIYIESNSNIISGNNVGTDVTGQVGIPNFNGIWVVQGSSNQIGTSPFTPNPAAARNIVSGNTNNGVSITSLGSNNFVSGNCIGVKLDGVNPLPNVIGVLLDDVNRTLVGGTSVGERNVISGNTQYGVLISGVNAFGNLLQGNYIGTNIAGTGAVGNGLGGVLVRGGAVFNRIGAFADSGPLETARRNVISGNGGRAVTIQDSTTTDIRVMGNYIGLTADGLSPLGNVQGVAIIDSPANLIGAPGSGRNLIAAQTNAAFGDGVTIVGINATTNKVQNNLIGVTAGGAPAGNAAAGVSIASGAVGTLIGGTAIGEGNTIVNSGGPGVRVLGDNSVANSILGNSINASGGLGIDLVETTNIYGVTANGPANVVRIGPNSLQNYPVITSVSGNGIISATLAAIGDTNYRIEYFSSVSPDPTLFGEGRTFLGFKNVTTNPSGLVGPFNFPALVPPGENYITATATQLSAGGQSSIRGFPTEPGAPLGTSEFSRTVSLNTPPMTSDQNASTPEDTDAVITLLASDADVGQTITFHISLLPTLGQLLQFGTLTPISLGEAVTDPSGRVVFRPAPNQFGVPYTTFAFVANDSLADSNESIVTVDVTPVADTPSVTDVTTAEGVQSTTPPGLVISRNGVDGAEVTHFKITTIAPPGSGTLFQNNGTTPITSGQFITFAQGNAGLRFTPAPGFNGTATFNVQAAIGNTDAGIGGGTVTAHIFVTSVADRPNVTDVTTLEDTQSTTPPGLVITRSALDGPDVTHFKVSGLTPGGQLFLADGLTPVNGVGAGSFITAAQGNAGLRYTPAADYNGIATFQVRASIGAVDSGLSLTSATATITITPVNDRPSFTAANPPAVAEDVGPVVVSGWVANFTAGPANESGQTVLGYLVSGVTNAALFTAGGQPTVDSAGVLRYTPAPNTSGTSQFTVRVQDNGGVANGGVDTSLPQTFTITVGPVNDAPTFVAANPPSLLEDVGPVVVAGWAHDFSAGPADESTQTILGYLVSGVTNASLFTAGGQPTVDAAGVLRYTPAVDANGTSQFTVRVQDNGGTASGGVDTSAPQTFTITVGPVNDAPSFVAIDPPAVAEDSGPAVVAGWAHTFAPGPVTAVDEVTQTNLGYAVSLITNPGLFSALPTVDAAGVLRYTPAPDAFGTSQFTVRVQDSGGTANGGVDTSAPQTFTITVGGVNDRPSFVATDPASVLEDVGPVVVAGWAHDFSAGPANESTQTILGYLVSGVSNAALFAAGGEPTVDATGVLRYTPAIDANGTSQFTVRVQDNGGVANGGVDTSLPQTFTITVGPVNDAPSFVAANPPGVMEDAGPQVVPAWAHTFTPGPVTAVDEATQLNIGYAVSNVTNPALFAVGGEPTVDLGGVLRYTPMSNTSGTSQFTVRVQDNGGVANGGVDTSAPQTFTIVVGNINDPPTFVAADPPPVLEDSGPAVVVGWAHDFSPGPPDEATQTNLGYTVSLIGNPNLFAVGGQPTVDATGTLRYTPAPDAFGTSDFTVVVRDSGGTADGGQDTSSPRVFIITVVPVNDAPSYVASNPPGVLEDAGAQVLAGWAHNVSVGPLNESMLQGILGYTISGVTNPGLFAAGGAPTVDNGGTLRYTPAPDAFGTSQFTVVLRDDGGTANGGVDSSVPQTFTITVGPVNDAPSFAAANPPAVAEDVGAVVVNGWVTNFSAGPPNESGQAVLAYLVSGVTNGALFTAGGQPTVDNVGVLRYTPAPDANGTSQFTVRVRDNGGTADGGVDTSAPQTFTITVGAVNDAPSFVAATPPSVLEDAGSQTVAAWAHTFVPGPVTALDEATQTNLGYQVSGVTNVALFAAGGQPTVDAAGALHYTPAADANGTSQFTVRVQDSGGTANGGVDLSPPQTFTITVLAVNDAPGFVAADPPPVLEDVGAVTVAGWAHTFTPGPATATDEAAQTILGYTVSGVTNAALFTNAPTVDAAGALHYTPAPDAFGSSQFTVVVRDSGGTANGGVDTSAPQTFTIVVGPVNDAPSYVAANPPAVLEDVGPVVVSGWVTSVSVGPANESTQVVLGYLVSGVSNAALFTAGGQPTVDSAGVLRYTPAPDANGTSTFTVRVQDDGGTANGGVDTSAPQTFTITVGPVNDAPSFVAANPPAVLEDIGPVVVAGWVTSVSVGPANESGQAVLAYLVSGLTNATLFAPGGQPTVDNAGVLRYTPAPDANGTSQFTVRVQDNGGTADGGVDTSAPQTFTITVGPVNDAPTFVAANPPSVLEDASAVTIAGWAHDFLPGPATAGDEATQVNLGYTVSGVTNASLFSVQPTVDAAGVLRYTPAANANGTSQFTVRVQDSGGTANGGVDTSAPQTFTITVLAVNDAPSFVAADPPSVLEDVGPVVVAGWASAFTAGPPDEQLAQTALGYTVSGVSNPTLFAAGGAPTVDNAGVLRYTPAADAFGTSLFTVVVQDSGGTANGGVDTSAPRSFLITVGPVNDAPTFAAANPPPVLESTGTHTVALFINAFNAGPANEAGQTLNAVLVDQISNTSLFAPGGEPSIGTNATLTYTLTPGVYGTTTFRVRVMDSGGTNDGGVDTSAPQTFTLAVYPIAVCQDVTIDARLSCPPLTVTEAQINLTPRLTDPTAMQSFTYSRPLTVPFPIGTTPVIVTVTYAGGLVSHCTARVTVLANDCNGDSIPDACQGGGPGSTTDCNGDGIPDDCQCVWDDGMVPPGDAPTANGQLSHLGSQGSAVQAADDFYLCPNRVYRLFGFRGQMFNNSIIRKARLEFYEDCNGAPVATPFKTFTNSTVVAETPATDGYTLVTYFFDLCSECFMLEGGKTYWVSLVGVSDGQQTDLSYWATTTPVSSPQTLMGMPPFRRTGIGGPVPYPFNYGNWQTTSECCEGCVNLSWKLTGEDCLVAWDNGKIDLGGSFFDGKEQIPGTGCGSPSGADRANPTQPRTADNFVLSGCEPTQVCYIETYIWTNCNPVHGFVELYANECGIPVQTPGVPFSPPPTAIVPGLVPILTATATRVELIPGATLVYNGATLYGYKLVFCNPGWTLQGGRTYWISSGSTAGGSLSGQSLFACAAPPCDSTCFGGKLTSGMFLNRSISPLAWADTGHEYAFKIAVRGNLGLVAALAASPAVTQLCPADINNSGGLDTQDIFDYLNMWFSGCP